MNTLSHLLTMLSVLAITLTLHAETNVYGGDVSGGWPGGGSPYLIHGDITVPTGETLALGPGIELRFSGHHALVVRGTLLAMGVPGDSVRIGAAESGMYWGGIRFLEAGTGSELNYTVIRDGYATAFDPEDTGGWGGAILCVSSSPLISNCRFAGNLADHFGGAIRLFAGSHPLIESCAFVDNMVLIQGAASGAGGALAARRRCDPLIRNCLVRGNSALSGPGGFQFQEDCQPLITGCRFIENTGGDRGGAVQFADNSSGRLESCCFQGNSSTGSGSGLFCEQSAPVLIHASFCGNRAYGGAAATVHLNDNSHPVMLNSIVWNNTPRAFSFSSSHAANTLMLAYSDVEGGETAIESNQNGLVYYMEGNIDLAPQFCSPALFDLSLEETSPCIDAGIACYAWDDQVLVDVEAGDYCGSAPDMGFCESGLTSVSPRPLAASFVLEAPVPNPFNPSTRISFQLTATSTVDLRVFNLQGSEVVVLEEGVRPAGWHHVQFDGRELASGFYLARLAVGSEARTERMLLIR